MEYIETIYIYIFDDVNSTHVNFNKEMSPQLRVTQALRRTLSYHLLHGLPCQPLTKLIHNPELKFSKHLTLGTFDATLKLPNTNA